MKRPCLEDLDPETRSLVLALIAAERAKRQKQSPAHGESVSWTADSPAAPRNGGRR